MKGFYKIPRRQVYCGSVGSWLKTMVWIFGVLKVFKQDVDAIVCKCGSYGLGGERQPKAI